MSVKTDDLSDTKKVVTRWQQVTCGGIEEEAVSHKITGWLCRETVCMKCADVKIIRCKIYFVFIFVVYANHKNIFTMKISRSTVYTICFCK